MVRKLVKLSKRMENAVSCSEVVCEKGETNCLLFIYLYDISICNL